MIEENSKVTHPDSWIIRDHHDAVWGPFVSAEDARIWAKRKWPSVPERDYSEDLKILGWEIELLHWPD